MAFQGVQEVAKRGPRERLGGPTPEATCTATPKRQCKIADSRKIKPTILEKIYREKYRKNLGKCSAFVGASLW